MQKEEVNEKLGILYQQYKVLSANYQLTKQKKKMYKILLKKRAQILELERKR